MLTPATFRDATRLLIAGADDAVRTDVIEEAARLVLTYEAHGDHEALLWVKCVRDLANPEGYSHNFVARYARINNLLNELRQEREELLKRSKAGV